MRRNKILAELDAIYAHLYGINKKELEHILESFIKVKETDLQNHGNYITKQLILKYYNEYNKNSDLNE